MASLNAKSFLKFALPVIEFEPIGPVTNVFFDDNNYQVFSVRSGGATGILVRGFTKSLCSTFRMEDKGSLFSIKLSPDHKILSFQRSKLCVTFVKVIQTGLNGIIEDADHEFNQCSRNKNAIIKGFAWTNVSEIAIFTTTGIELYAVLADRRLLRVVRQQQTAIAWYVYCHRTSIAVISPNNLPCNTLQPFLITDGYIYKLGKITFTPLEDICIRDRDVFISRLYDDVLIYIGVMIRSKNQPGLHLFELSRDHTSLTKRHILQIPNDVINDDSSTFAFNVIDDLVIIHGEGGSFIYDIKLISTNEEEPILHYPALVVFSVTSSVDGDSPETYSTQWITFQPDVVIDAKRGRMWRLDLNVEAAIQIMYLSPLLPSLISNDTKLNDVLRLVTFLLQRERDGKHVLICLLLMLAATANFLVSFFGPIFDKINVEYRTYLIEHTRANLASPVEFPALKSSSDRLTMCSSFQSTVSIDLAIPSKIILDQSDINDGIFVCLVQEHRRVCFGRITDIIIEYLCSLQRYFIPIQNCVSQLLINLLVQDHKWFQLKQLLHYRVILDSKSTACFLLSLESVHASAGQWAIDMLFRLGNSTEEICEILLARQLILPALKLAASSNRSNYMQLSARKYLECAINTKDDFVFYSVFKYFESRNLEFRGSPAFIDSDRCGPFLLRFNLLFGDKTKE